MAGQWMLPCLPEDKWSRSEEEAQKLLDELEGINHDHIVIPHVLPLEYRSRSQHFGNMIYLLQLTSKESIPISENEFVMTIKSTDVVVQSLILRLTHSSVSQVLVKLFRLHWKYLLEEIPPEQEQMDVEFISGGIEKIDLGSIPQLDGWLGDDPSE